MISCSDFCCCVMSPHIRHSFSVCIETSSTRGGKAKNRSLSPVPQTHYSENTIIIITSQPHNPRVVHADASQSWITSLRVVTRVRTSPIHGPQFINNHGHDEEPRDSLSLFRRLNKLQDRVHLCKPSISMCCLC